MFKNLLLIFAIFCCIKTIAQPVLSSAYFPQTGKTLIGKTFKKGVALPEISEGPNQTWNFSGIDSVYIQDFNFMIKAKTVASTDSGIKFPDAQSANISYFGGDSIQNYFKVSGFDLQYIGYNLKGLADKEKFTMPRVEFRSGLAFEEVFINQSRCRKDFYGDVIYKKYRDTITYAGYGTLITPTETHNNVVLLKNRFSIEFNNSGNPNLNYEIGYLGTQWLWYLPGYGVPYMKYSEEIDWADRTLVFYEGYVGIPQPLALPKIQFSRTINIFPGIIEKNQIVNVNGLETGQKSFAKIFDIQGQMVQSQEVENSSFKINALKTGLYVVVLENENGLSRHKILVK